MNKIFKTIAIVGAVVFIIYILGELALYMQAKRYITQYELNFIRQQWIEYTNEYDDGRM